MGLTCLERINKIIAHEPAELSGEPLKNIRRKEIKSGLLEISWGMIMGFR